MSLQGHRAGRVPTSVVGRIAGRLLGVVGLVLAVGCGDPAVPGSDRPKERDIGPVAAPDSGDRCASNPFGCTPDQGRDGACRCLSGPDPSDAGSDAGSGEDRGVSPDPMDAGALDVPAAEAGSGGECRSDEDCPGAQRACVFASGGQEVEACAGRTGCRCVTGCDPFAERALAGCGPEEVCYFLGDAAPLEGACVRDPDPTAGTQDAPCTVRFDGQGRRSGSEGCSEVQNFACWGASPAAPAGRCARFCRPGQDTLCERLGDYRCVDLAGGGLGLCLRQSPATDIGRACTDNRTCEAGLCVPGIGCSASCEGLGWCPEGSMCLDVGQRVCFRECATDAACASLDPNMICRTFGAGASAYSVCFPRCRADADCGAGGTCDQGTGRCR